MKWMMGGLFLFCTVYLFLRWFERRALYAPFRPLTATPQAVGCAFADARIIGEDGVRLHGWYVPAVTETVWTVIFFHGNAGNISHRLEKLAVLHAGGLNVLLVDYRGYGKSRGVPGERGLYRDADAAWRWVLSRIPSARVIVYGESLGAAVAIELAMRRPEIRGLIVEGGFTGIADMCRIVYPLLPTRLVRSRYDSLAKIPQVTAPLLLFHAVDDEIVPFAMGKRLYAACGTPWRFVALSGGHNGAFFAQCSTVVLTMQEYLRWLSSREQ